jgi:glycosyltransferase involved in cell wall biosynthesis
MEETPSLSVSIYVPCRNAENHIARTLESVFAQTYQILEVIAVDDGSTDETERILESFPVQVIRHPRSLGITRTRNTALEHVRGEFVASVDADVILSPNWLERIMTNFSGGFVGGVGGRTIEMNTESLFGQWMVAHRNPDRGKEKDHPPALPTSAVVYRRKALLEIGGFNDDKRYDHSDLDAAMRVVMIGYRLVYEPQAVCYHHFQGDQRAVFDGVWNYRKDAYVNCGLFTNPSGLGRKVEINSGEFYQMLMDDFHAGRHAIMPLSVVGALRHSLLDIRQYARLHPDRGGVDTDTFGALKTGLRYLFDQKKEISPPLEAQILGDVLDIRMDSEAETVFERFSGHVGEEELTSHLKNRFPHARLDRVSHWLTIFLGFLNSLPEEVWDVMNRHVENGNQGQVT